VAESRNTRSATALNVMPSCPHSTDMTSYCKS
jgi:hypothetical protein